ncbi:MULTISPECIES: hypothetical protein [unclassified Wolbachia]|uniref:hypothetical protein n=1 Tax=unclassified Wolbachia TaxID=2640676 RepID=UPI0022302997|nr:hypothetical protein [Wolbachia endosymbiont (group A) of Apoderus coryli]
MPPSPVIPVPSSCHPSAQTTWIQKTSQVSLRHTAAVSLDPANKQRDDSSPTSYRHSISRSR